MGGIKISNYQDVAGKRERSVSLYVIDSSFKGAGNNGPLPPTNCAANRKEADNMCSYKNLNVRAPRNATICISHEHRPFRHVYTGEGIYAPAGCHSACILRPGISQMRVAQLVLPDDLCVPAPPCLGEEEGTPCDDDDPATINDACQADGLCVGVASPCAGKNEGDPCDDGDPATANDKCQAGFTCVGALSKLSNPLIGLFASHWCTEVGMVVCLYPRRPTQPPSAISVGGYPLLCQFMGTRQSNHQSELLCRRSVWQGHSSDGVWYPNIRCLYEA